MGTGLAHCGSLTNGLTGGKYAESASNATADDIREGWPPAPHAPWGFCSGRQHRRDRSWRDPRHVARSRQAADLPGPPTVGPRRRQRQRLGARRDRRLRPQMPRYAPGENRNLPVVVNDAPTRRARAISRASPCGRAAGRPRLAVSVRAAAVPLPAVPRRRQPGSHSRALWRIRNDPAFSACLRAPSDASRYGRDPLASLRPRPAGRFLGRGLTACRGRHTLEAARGIYTCIHVRGCGKTKR